MYPAEMTMPDCSTSCLGLVGLALACSLWAGSAAADVQHTVARGHTIEAIAHRYHVSVKAIVDANHLHDPRHLRVGETLVIPGVTAAKGGKPGATAGGSFAMRAKTPGVVHITRLATSEDFVIRVSSRRGHVAPVAQKTFERVMRSTSGLTHPPDPRLVALLGTVSNHFGSRRIEVISGYRPYSSTQYTAHSNHNIGHALDFRVVGVPNEVLRDYCKTLHNVGVGYYPNSTFVHLDVRESPATWIDYSKPGEPPRYSVPGVDADEGTSDVSEEAMTPESAAPSEAPPPPSPPASPFSPPQAAAPQASPPQAGVPPVSPPLSPSPAPSAEPVTPPVNPPAPPTSPTTPPGSVTTPPAN
jgi:uncharacterized protein YcbK (DUF882 family)